MNYNQCHDTIDIVTKSVGTLVVAAVLTQGGKPVMYNVSVHFVPSSAPADAGVGTSTVSASRRIGFRTAYLTTGNDTDPAWVAANADGNGNANPANTVMWRINGAPTVMRGANLIPMETLEGRYAAGMHRQLVKSSAEANFNLIRAQHLIYLEIPPARKLFGA